MRLQRYYTYRLFLGRKISQANRAKAQQAGASYVPNDVADGALATWLKRRVTPGYPGYTVFTAMGSWEGVHEKTAILEIMVPATEVVSSELPGKIEALAENYKSTFYQDCVMVQVLQSPATFV